jgi:signal transduction histidine kinase
VYTLKVLVTDDEPGMRQGIQRTLEKYKMKLPDVEEGIEFNIETAETGSEALDKISSFKPDLILLDYKLPDLTGLEILEKIDSNDGTMQTIMITAYASLDTAVSAIKSGAFDFLSKPFTPDELRAKISKAAQSIILAKHVKKLNEEKRQVRFQFISILGHELKAPLNAIEGYLNMFHDRSIGTEIEKYDESIGRCLVRTDQMRKLIADLLEMTKIESGSRQREITQVDLAAIAQASIDLVLPDAKKRNITISLNSISPLKFSADKFEMELIFNNLISNAVKYNRDGGSVDINLDMNAFELNFSIQDTGIGMTQDETKKLFQEFVRIKNKKTSHIMGSGLGLSTVKKVCQLYNGDIFVESEPDAGTRFFGSIKAV